MFEVDSLGDGIRAAFTTVSGGISPAPWKSLNLGLNTGDESARVAANRERVERSFGVPVLYADQVHGTDVAVVERSDGGPVLSRGTADAIVSTQPDVGIGVLVADCVPVLLADPVHRAVGVAHAGRVGLLSGVLEAAVDAMVAKGAEVGDIRAVVGPSACGSCYEVPEAMRGQAQSDLPQIGSTTSWNTPALDLPAAAGVRLRRAGVGYVDIPGWCTFEDSRFFSYRLAAGNGNRTGRFAGLITLS